MRAEIARYLIVIGSVVTKSENETIGILMAFGIGGGRIRNVGTDTFVCLQ